MSVILLSVVAALGVSLVAVADNNNNVCESGEVCFYNNINYSGIEIDSSANSSNWPFLGIENDDDSVKNRRSGLYVVVYNKSGYEGALYCADPGEWEDDIHSSRENAGDSHKQFSGSTCPAAIPHP